MTRSQDDLLHDGVRLMVQFCRKNHILPPVVVQTPTLGGQPWPFSVCAFYRPTQITINIRLCARPGYGGRAWSWPGYVIDRTPYGVIQHELGHHVDWLLTKVADRRGWRGRFSSVVRQGSHGEQPISGYCPDTNEWFAEMFRLFVTNPDLLEKIRPAVYVVLSRVLKPYFTRPWQALLTDAPARTIEQAAKKIKKEAERWQQDIR